MTRIKICGIRDLDIANYVIEQGAHALGFVFYEKSPRYITRGDARDIIRKLPGFVAKVGVFADKDSAEIAEIADFTGIDTIQLHGSYEPGAITVLREHTALPVIYAVRINELTDETLNGVMNIEANNILIDKYDPEVYGGTGQTIATGARLSENSRKFLRERVILAGGINPSNIRRIIGELSPYAVDLSSGVEKEKGIKDKKLIQTLFQEYRKASI